MYSQINVKSFLGSPLWLLSTWWKDSVLQYQSLSHFQWSSTFGLISVFHRIWLHRLCFYHGFILLNYFLLFSSAVGKLFYFSKFSFRYYFCNVLLNCDNLHENSISPGVEPLLCNITITSCVSSHSCRQWGYLEWTQDSCHLSHGIIFQVFVSAWIRCSASATATLGHCCFRCPQLLITLSPSDVECTSHWSFTFVVVYLQGSYWSQWGQHYSHSAKLACPGAKPLPLCGVEA